ncbi:5-oxoprolinase subunit PxpA [Gymnodinialimonas sp. 57CJ19]|uniref:LamB/YcsF family protein n=1 Tax=Gymnodinialimonas sp. 57CJ19 TaxID=3138498 RepID=UPI0031342FE4
MARRIDLNSDLGESFGPWSMGDDATMLSIVTSANIACGGHASDPETMFQTLVSARENGVSIGAHPGYNDREGFGRRVIPMAPAEITRLVAAQIGALQGVAALAGARVSYVKAHGALANLSARDRKVADAIVRAVAAIDPSLAVLAISGTQTEQAARAAGQPVFSEVFADRGYLSTGELVPRGQEGAMIHDAEFAADRLLELLETGHMPVIDGAPIALDAHSICVHGDSPGAVVMASTIRTRLEAQGVEVKGFLTP